jgi:uncharacterized protein (TIGR00730 family)
VTRVCVFCGSAAGARAEYAEAARALAAELARRSLGLVYGGASVGLMGLLADTALAAGVEVIGVIPRGLFARELAHPGLTELRVVDSMHERKATMASLVDAFVALPGGLGTLEETLEVLTWSLLGIHRKPIGLLNTAAYYQGLLTFFDHATTEGFINPTYLNLFLSADTPTTLLDRLTTWQPTTTIPTWLSKSQT